MTQTLKQAALEYEPKSTANIADLDVAFTDLPVKEKQFNDKDGKPFTVKVMEYMGIEYRVPDSVLADLKEILDERPNLRSFRVRKSGEGMKTKYTVIALQDFVQTERV